MLNPFVLVNPYLLAFLEFLIRYERLFQDSAHVGAPVKTATAALVIDSAVKWRFGSVRVADNQD